MPKEKLSVSIDRAVLERALRAGGDRSRSQIVELALAHWSHARRRAAIDAEIASYYAGRSAAEQAEDNRWARTGDDTFRPRR